VPTGEEVHHRIPIEIGEGDVPSVGFSDRVQGDPREPDFPQSRASDKAQND